MWLLKLFLGFHYIAQYATIVVFVGLGLLAILKLPGRAGALLGGVLFTIAGFAVAYNMGYRDRGKECNVADLTRKIDEQKATITYQGGLIATERQNTESYRTQLDALADARNADATELAEARKKIAAMAAADPKDANAELSPIIRRAIRGK